MAPIIDSLYLSGKRLFGLSARRPLGVKFMMFRRILGKIDAPANAGRPLLLVVDMDQPDQSPNILFRILTYTYNQSTFSEM